MSAILRALTPQFQALGLQHAQDLPESNSIQKRCGQDATSLDPVHPHLLVITTGHLHKQQNSCSVKLAAVV